MSEDDFREYLAFASVEPIGPARLDWWASQLLAAAINPHLKRQYQVDAKDLRPDWWQDRKPTGTLDGFTAWLTAMSQKGTGNVDVRR